MEQILLFLEQYDKIIIDASPVKSFFKAINVFKVFYYISFPKILKCVPKRNKYCCFWNGSF